MFTVTNAHFSLCRIYILDCMFVHNQIIMGYRINITGQAFEEVLNRQRAEKKAKVLRRLNAIIMKSKNHPNKEIAHILGVNENTITYWVKIYLREGVKGLCDLKYEKHNVI